MTFRENRRKIGAKAEAFVAEYLVEKGYEILERNFTIRGGEIDIIVGKDSLLVFVEVRSWHREMWPGGTPLETITSAKIRHIIKTSLFYIQKKSVNLSKSDIRYDVAGLIKDGDSYKLDYHENAFTADGYF